MIVFRLEKSIKILIISFFIICIFKFYDPVILFRITINSTKNPKTVIAAKNLNLGFLNKFLRGVRITNINPAKLLIKNRG